MKLFFNYGMYYSKGRKGLMSVLFLMLHIKLLFISFYFGLKYDPDFFLTGFVRGIQLLSQTSLTTAFRIYHFTLNCQNVKSVGRMWKSDRETG